MGAILHVRPIFFTYEQLVNYLVHQTDRPDELVKRSEDVTCTPRIFDVALLANKYAFRGLEKWSVKSLLKTIHKGQSTTSTSTTSTPPSTELPSEIKERLYPEILRFAVANNYVRLERLVTEYFLKVMKTSYKHTVAVIDMASRLERDDLLGRAYFHLLSMPAYMRDMDLGDGVALTRTHRVRLLTGFENLVLAWEPIRRSAPQFGHCADCEDGDGQAREECRMASGLFWEGATRSEVVLGKDVFDVVGRLRVLCAMLETPEVSLLASNFYF